MAQEQPQAPSVGEPARVLRFRRPPPERPVTPGRASELEDEAFDDLARYEEELGDERRRMLMNAIAIVIVIVLIVFGVWIADTFAEMEKDQDCVLQGRANCAPIEVAAPRR